MTDCPELKELLTISHFVGCNPDWVQGGGGNTSVKSADRLWVKASGSELGQMDARRGWACLDLVRARDLIRDPALTTMSEANREAAVVERLMDSVLEPEGARPSVESSLHALLGRVVIHTHPIGLNAVLCAEDSAAESLRVVGDGPAPLYIPYVDPGYVLAVRLAEELERYRQKHGRDAQVILLENHGLFVVGETAAECQALHLQVTGRGESWIGGEPVNPADLEWVSTEASPDPRAVKLRRALLRGGAAPGVVRQDRTPVAARFIADAEAVAAVRTGPFTPDQIVYCRTVPLVLDPDSPDTWPQAVRTYRDRIRLDPRLILLPGHSVWATAPDLRQWRVATETFRAAMSFALHSRRAGGARHLDRRQISFIEDWEVEQYRARLMAGDEVSLAGCVVAFAGTDVPDEWLARLDAEGVTVVHVEGAAASTSRVLNVAADPAWPSTVVASVGGVDLVVHGDGAFEDGIETLALDPESVVPRSRVSSLDDLLECLRVRGTVSDRT